MRIGVRGHDLNVKGTDCLISGLKRAGADTLQLVCYKSFDGVPYAPYALEDGEARVIGSALRDNGIDVALLGAYFNPVHPEPAKLENGVAVFKDYIRLAKSLGAEVIGSETGSFNGDKWTYHPSNRTEAARSRVAEVFRELCLYAGEYGVNVGIEGAAGHVCHNAAALKDVMELVGCRNLRVIYDLYNFMDADNTDYIALLEEGLSVFGRMIHCFHIKDCIFTDGAPKQCPVGAGELDFTQILSKIKQHDPDAVLILEGTTGEDIPPALSLINGIWASVQPSC